MRVEQGGYSMIEVLVTFAVVSIGLLGLNSLQSATVLSGFEAYQRSMLISILDDMTTRIQMNPDNVDSYTVSTNEYYGTKDTGADCTILQGASRDLCEWNIELAGINVRDVSGKGTAAPYGARGCIDRIDSETVKVSVAWMGISKQVTSTESCAQGTMPEKNRRVISREVVVH